MVELLWLSLSLFSSPVLTTRLVVSGYNSQLALYNVLSEAPWLERAGEWEVDPSMTWLQVIQEEGSTVIYGAHEVGEFEGVAGGVVSRWSGTADGGLVKDGFISLPSPYPAHLLVSQEQGLAYTANYGGNSFTAVAVDSEGSLGEVVYQESFGEGCRDASHPHQTVTYGQWVWVVDLGCDSIWHYKYVGEPGSPGLEKLGNTSVRAGAGPRHMAVLGERGLVVLVSELQSLLELYRLDPTDGSLELLQQLELSSTEGDYGAEVVLGPQEKFIYVSSRGRGELVVYRLDQEEDKLHRVQEFKLGGTWPRHMARKGQSLVVADQKGDSLQVVQIDQETGLLAGWDLNFNTPSQPAFMTFFD